MSFKFEKLLIWQKAMDLAEEIHELSKKFPKEELYNLTGQINRAADSIALNIAEGSISQTNPEQHRFLGYSIRSIAEVVTCLYKAKRRNYITIEEFEKNYKDSFDLMNMTIGFKNNIK
ncbi:four helix bundle protein [Algoriphagus aquaeductus]|uniref:Four helix bundle protein n=1 Tax=Algoriphagus aquaeductus TaxID=475299 RepID=A0A326S179_9BACT|nr:four helix bundle protein [Algoriphagus aquaeductus]PZV87337.1 four helix bundle protein [Algoriphagus aquaeductus]